MVRHKSWNLQQIKMNEVEIKFMIPQEINPTWNLSSLLAQLNVQDNFQKRIWEWKEGSISSERQIYCCWVSSTRNRVIIASNTIEKLTELIFKKKMFKNPIISLI